MPVSAKPTVYTAGAATLRPNHLWMFDEGSGTTLTDIGATGGKNLTIVGADWTTDATHGDILDFIAANLDYAHRTETGSEPVMGITTGFTVALILRVANTPAATEPMAAVSDVSAGNVYYQMGVDLTGDLIVSVRNTTALSNDNVPTALQDDAWHLAVATFGDSTQSCSVDGANYEASTLAANINDAAIDTFAIGSRRETGPAYGDVKVAAAAVWINTLLDETQQTSLWNGGDVWAAMGITETTAVKKLKLLAHQSAIGATNVEGVVLNAARDTVIGEFSGQAFEAALEGDEAVLKIPVADISPDGAALSIDDVPLAIAYNATYSTALVSCTLIEE